MTTTKPAVVSKRTLIRTEEGVVDIDLSHLHGPRVVFPETLSLRVVSELCAPHVVDFACGVGTMGSRFIAAPICSTVA